MSIIGSVGGTDLDIISMLQSLTQQNEETEGVAARGSPPQGAPPDGPPPAGGAITDQVGEFAESAGLDSETVTSLQDELSAAISSALENSEGTTDPRELIDEAVLNTMEEYGLDGEAFLTEFKASMPEGPPDMGANEGQLSNAAIVSQMFGSVDSDATTLSSSLSLLNAIA